MKIRLPFKVDRRLLNPETLKNYKAPKKYAMVYTYPRKYLEELVEGKKIIPKDIVILIEAGSKKRIFEVANAIDSGASFFRAEKEARLKFMEACWEAFRRAGEIGVDKILSTPEGLVKFKETEIWYFMTVCAHYGGVVYSIKVHEKFNAYYYVGTPIANEDFFDEVIDKDFDRFFLVVMDDYGILEECAPNREAYEIMRAECRRIIEEYERKHKQQKQNENKSQRRNSLNYYA